MDDEKQTQKRKRETINISDDEDVLLSGSPTPTASANTSAAGVTSNTTTTSRIAPNAAENVMETTVDSDADDEELPSREECQRLVEQFAELTSTDTALAQSFLQDRAWNLQQSVNAYFESRDGSAKSGNVNNKDPELEVMFDSQLLTAAETRELEQAAALGHVTTEPPTHFKLLTWNIDGLDDCNLKKRTKAIVKIIEIERPDIVFLQELIPATFQYLEEKLCQYMFIAAGADEYFCATLLLRTTVYFDSHLLIPFPNSRMGRNLLEVQAHIGMCSLRLLTSHLESTAEFTGERKKQLRIALDRVTAAPPHVNCVLAGDFNLRDKEVAEVGLPNGVVDVWEATGRRPESQYTWDLTRNTNKEMGRIKPRCRFDRVYVRRGDGGRSAGGSDIGKGGKVVVAQHFGLVGMRKVVGTQSYPSDHWGVMVHFNI